MLVITASEQIDREQFWQNTPNKHYGFSRRPRNPQNLRVDFVQRPYLINAEFVFDSWSYGTD
jgi:hypothetical protein